MSALYQRFYYCLLTFITLFSGPIIMDLNPQKASYVFVASLFENLLTWKFNYSIVFMLTAISALSCIFNPTLSRKILCAFSFLLLLSIQFSFGKINHGFHIWAISSIILCLMDPNRLFNSKSNLSSIRICQSLLLSIYFIAGLWKIRGLELLDLKGAALNQIAYAVAEGNGPPQDILQLIAIDQPWLSGLGLCLIILFQLSTGIPIFKQKYFKYWGVMALLFHMTTGIVLGIWFTPTVLAVLFFLIFTEFWINFESSLWPNENSNASKMTP